MTTSTPETKTALNDYAEYTARQAEMADIETARVRGWGYFLGAYLTGPIWPAVIATRTKKWTPFWAGLGTYLMAEKSKEKRRKLNIISPEQADVVKFSKM